MEGLKINFLSYFLKVYTFKNLFLNPRRKIRKMNQCTVYSSKHWSKLKRSPRLSAYNNYSDDPWQIWKIQKSTKEWACLRNLKTKEKFKRKVLTNNLITKFSYYYGLAVREHSDIVENIKRAINILLWSIYAQLLRIPSITYTPLAPKIGVNTRISRKIIKYIRSAPAVFCTNCTISKAHLCRFTKRRTVITMCER